MYTIKSYIAPFSCNIIQAVGAIDLVTSYPTHQATFVYRKDNRVIYDRYISSVSGVIRPVNYVS